MDMSEKEQEGTLSPEKLQTYYRLRKDFTKIKENAKRVGKSVDQYLTDIGIDPDIIHYLSLKMQKMAQTALENSWKESQKAGDTFESPAEPFIATQVIEKRLRNFDEKIQVQKRETNIEKMLTWIYRIVILVAIIWILINQISNQGIGRYQSVLGSGRWAILDTKTGRFYISEPPQEE